MMRNAVTLIVATLVLGGCGKHDKDAATQPVNDVAPVVADAEKAGATFDAAIDQLTRSYYQQVPEAATYNGIPDELTSGADARLNDRSVEGDKARVAEMEKRLAELQATSPDSLSADQRRIRSTLITLFDGALGPMRVADYGSGFDAYGIWYLPYVIIQNSGVTVDVPKLMEAQQTVRNAAEATEYLERLELFPGILDGALARMRHDVDLGAIPPDFIVQKSKAVVDAFAAIPAADNVLVTSFASKLKAADVADADSYSAKALDIVGNGVIPAYQRISAYLGEIEPLAPHDAGVWRLPNGAALYKAMIRHMTDSDLDAEEVHQIGLDEVARITAEMDVLLREQGYTEGTVGERMIALAADPRYVFPNTPEGKAQLLASIEKQMADMNALLPKLFGNVPRHPIELRAVPEFSQDSAPGGYYDPPSPDGSRPGIYWVNLRDTAALPKFSAPTLTFHEAIPGHHMQMAIAIDQDAPFIAKSFYSNSAGEGWALYAEALAAEMGMYADDPIGDIGRLRDELHRAVRLVVDTGMHARKWSREEAIDYMVATEGADQGSAVSEIERYVVWPGQALGYKIGMLRIQQLRKEAEAAYGDQFDIREFHDRLLAISASALPVIESEMRAWIAKAGEQK
ncbi:DUF885 domain-containing protein [Dokdonella sp.]|uniref:DUF885 domain-containing protein n=1 Tax=Dokdonella sp. TaxID=2291710 RepID=UPI003C477CE1